MCVCFFVRLARWNPIVYFLMSTFFAGSLHPTAGTHAATTQRQSLQNASGADCNNSRATCAFCRLSFYAACRPSFLQTRARTRTCTPAASTPAQSGALTRAVHVVHVMRIKCIVMLIISTGARIFIRIVFALYAPLYASYALYTHLIRIIRIIRVVIRIGARTICI